MGFCRGVERDEVEVSAKWPRTLLPWHEFAARGGEGSPDREMFLRGFVVALSGIARRIPLVSSCERIVYYFLLSVVGWLVNS